MSWGAAGDGCRRGKTSGMPDCPPRSTCFQHLRWGAARRAVVCPRTFARSPRRVCDEVQGRSRARGLAEWSNHRLIPIPRYGLDPRSPCLAPTPHRQADENCLVACLYSASPGVVRGAGNARCKKVATSTVRRPQYVDACLESSSVARRPARSAIDKPRQDRAAFRRSRPRLQAVWRQAFTELVDIAGVPLAIQAETYDGFFLVLLI